MNWIQLANMPLVQNLIATAENKIKAATGVSVHLVFQELIRMDLSEVERRKIFTQDLVCLHFNVELGYK